MGQGATGSSDVPAVPAQMPMRRSRDRAAAGGPPDGAGQAPADQPTSDVPGPTEGPVKVPVVGSEGTASGVFPPEVDVDGEGTDAPPTPWRAVPAGPPPPPEKKKRKRRPFAMFLGVLGELLITLGLLLGLYVVWEIFWTTWETNNQVRAQMVELRLDPVWEVPELTGDGFAEERHGAPGTQCGIANPGLEELWGVMHVPRWGADFQVPVVEGTDRERILNKGLIGHYPDTQAPGAIGNFATSAHRTTYGAPYNRVEDLLVGDLAIFESPGCYLVYKMYDTEAVYPWEYRVVWPVPNQADATPTKRIMTFTTCHPPFSARQRFVVWFEMEYWTDKADGPLRVLTEPVEGG